MPRPSALVTAQRMFFVLNGERTLDRSYSKAYRMCVPARRSPSTPMAKPRCGKARILFVDDEASIRLTSLACWLGSASTLRR
jgi:hypothetical protein